jgi:2,3-dihydroxybenzoate decarboxylase
LLAEARAHPTRYIGMTAIAPQDPQWSAAEIRRGAQGFKGVLVNSHTHGEYLDEPKFDPIFRALADVGQPLYIHPTTPPDSMIGPMLEAGLDGAVFGFGVETGLHLLRLITGIFDRYPAPDHRGPCGRGPALLALPAELHAWRGRAFAALRLPEAAEARPVPLHAQQCAGDHQRDALRTRHPPVPRRAGRGSRDVRDGLSLPVRAREVRIHDNLAISDAAKKKLMQDNAERVFALV